MASSSLLCGSAVLLLLLTFACHPQETVSARYGSRSSRLSRYSRYRYAASSYRSSSYYYSTYRSYRSSYSGSSYYRSYNYVRNTYSRARSYVQSTTAVRYARQGYNTYNYYYYNMYYTSAAYLLMSNKHYREDDGLSVCENYEALLNLTNSSSPTVLGRFTCPLEFEPDDYKYCCGSDSQQYCCPFFANSANLAGVVIGSILGFVVLAAAIGGSITCCVNKYRRSQRARKRWRKAGLVARMAGKATNRVQPGTVRYIPSSYAPPPAYHQGYGPAPAIYGQYQQAAAPTYAGTPGPSGY